MIILPLLRLTTLVLNRDLNFLNMAKPVTSNSCCFKSNMNSLHETLCMSWLNLYQYVTIDIQFEEI